MLAALVLTLHLASLPPTAATPVTSVPVAAEGDQSIQRGLRNMAIGGLVALAGVALAPLAALVFGAGLGAAVVVRFFAGTNPALPFFTAGMFGGGLVAFGAATVIFGGLLWVGVNAALVLMRLNPDYKPGPSTEYLDM